MPIVLGNPYSTQTDILRAMSDAAAIRQRAAEMELAQRQAEGQAIVDAAGKIGNAFVGYAKLDYDQRQLDDRRRYEQQRIDDERRYEVQQQDDRQAAAVDLQDNRIKAQQAEWDRREKQRQTEFDRRQEAYDNRLKVSNQNALIREKQMAQFKSAQALDKQAREAGFAGGVEELATVAGQMGSTPEEVLAERKQLTSNWQQANSPSVTRMAAQGIVEIVPDPQASERVRQLTDASNRISMQLAGELPPQVKEDLMRQLYQLDKMREQYAQIKSVKVVPPKDAPKVEYIDVPDSDGTPRKIAINPRNGREYKSPTKAVSSEKKAELYLKAFESVNWDPQYQGLDSLAREREAWRRLNVSISGPDSPAAQSAGPPPQARPADEPPVFDGPPQPGMLMKNRNGVDMWYDDQTKQWRRYIP